MERGRPGDWRWNRTLHQHFTFWHGSNVFGETPKPAGHESRALQSLCRVGAGLCLTAGLQNRLQHFPYIFRHDLVAFRRRMNAVVLVQAGLAADAFQ